MEFSVLQSFGFLLCGYLGLHTMKPSSQNLFIKDRRRYPSACAVIPSIPSQLCKAIYIIETFQADWLATVRLL